MVAAAMMEVMVVDAMTIDRKYIEKNPLITKAHIIVIKNYFWWIAQKTKNPVFLYFSFVQMLKFLKAVDFEKNIL